MTNRDELIKKYIRRQLDKSEKEAFDHFLITDEQFAKDVQWASKLTAARHIELEQSLNAYEKQRNQRFSKRALATIALLIVVGFYFRDSIKKALFPTSKEHIVEPIKTDIKPPIANSDTLKIELNQTRTNKIDIKSSKDSIIKLPTTPSVFEQKNKEKEIESKVSPKDSARLQVNQLKTTPRQLVNLEALDSLNLSANQLTTNNVKARFNPTDTAKAASFNVNILPPTSATWNLNLSDTPDSIAFQTDAFTHFETFITQMRDKEMKAGKAQNDWRTLLFNQKYKAALTIIRQEIPQTEDTLLLNKLHLYGGILNASIPEGNRQEAIDWLKIMIDKDYYKKYAAEFLIKTYIELGEIENAKALLVKLPDGKHKLSIYLQKRL